MNSIHTKMSVARSKSAIALVLASLAGCAGGDGSPDEAHGVAAQAVSWKLSKMDVVNASGIARTYSDNKKISFKRDRIISNPFFTSFGTNGRACIHCHVPAEGWSISAAGVAARFAKPIDVSNPDCIVDPSTCAATTPADAGKDPVFRLVDGANSPLADISTPAAREAAFSMLRSRGVIRVGIGIPAGAEFTLDAVDDPYGYASAAQLSLFRRPLPATNLRLSPSGPHDPGPGAVITGVMWDGRVAAPGRDIIADLLDQANGATLGHAEAAAGLSDADRQAIVDFETGLHTAQVTDLAAGDLDVFGGHGGPEWLAASQPFYVGINDVVTGDAQTHAAFDPDVFTLYSGWATSTIAARAQLARGQQVFNRKPITISGVAGLNDLLDMAAIPGTCTSCHDSPNYGHHSVPLPIDIGVTAASRRTPDMPLYTLKNVTTGETRQTTDPGRALITGRWRDIGKFKGPILRGLAARPPYFHDGSAATLEQVVEFYQGRFGLILTSAEKADLVAFLRAL
jgi:hypothetical protein